MKNNPLILALTGIALMMSACSSAPKKEIQPSNELSLTELLTDRAIAQAVAVNSALTAIVESAPNMQKAMVEVRAVMLELGIPFSKTFSVKNIAELSATQQAMITVNLASKPATATLFKLGKGDANATVVKASKNLLAGKTASGEAKGLATSSKGEVNLVEISTLNSMKAKLNNDPQLYRDILGSYVSYLQNTGVSLVKATTCGTVAGVAGKPGLDATAIANYKTALKNIALNGRAIKAQNLSAVETKQMGNNCGRKAMLGFFENTLGVPASEVAATAETAVKQCSLFPQEFLTANEAACAI